MTRNRSDRADLLRCTAAVGNINKLVKPHGSNDMHYSELLSTHDCVAGSRALCKQCSLSMSDPEV